MAGICELVSETDDIGRLRGFYERLGPAALTEHEDRAWLRAGERCWLGIWSPGKKEYSGRGGRHIHFALSVDTDRLDSFAVQLREEGIEVEGRVQHDGGDGGVMALVEDGNGA